MKSRTRKSLEPGENCVLNTVAIDGGAASGKTTLAEKVAESMGYQAFSTGLIYRALAVVARDLQIGNRDLAAFVAQSWPKDFKICPENSLGLRSHVLSVFYRGRPLDAQQVNASDTAEQASLLSGDRAVREVVVDAQRQLALQGRVVLDGRDIGSVIAPEAFAKIFLVSDPDVAAARRAEALGQSVEDVKRAIMTRNAREVTRPVSPMVPAKDAVVISADQPFDAVLKAALTYIAGRLERLAYNKGPTEKTL